jgi:hypothetical protein
MGRLAGTVLLLLSLAATAAAATSPADVYRNAIQSAAAKSSVHYVVDSKIAGNTELMVGDAALGRGSQRITFTKGGTTGHVTVLVVANTAYVRGDSFTLVQFLGLTPAQAAQFAGKWFFLKPPSGAYRDVAQDVSLQSFVVDLLMPAPYTAVPATTIGGHAVTGVRSHPKAGGKSATVTLYVGAGSPLPVAQVEQGPSGKITTTLSRWNEHVSVTAPQGAVAFH